MDVLKLKGARASKGITQEQMSKTVGMTPKTYNRKELGLVGFSANEIQNVALTLCLTMEEINQIFFDGKITKCISESA